MGGRLQHGRVKPRALKPKLRTNKTKLFRLITSEESWQRSETELIS